MKCLEGIFLLERLKVIEIGLAAGFGVSGTFQVPWFALGPTLAVLFWLDFGWQDLWKRLSCFVPRFLQKSWHKFPFQELKVPQQLIRPTNFWECGTNKSFSLERPHGDAQFLLLEDIRRGCFCNSCFIM